MSTKALVHPRQMSPERDSLPGIVAPPGTTIYTVYATVDNETWPNAVLNAGSDRNTVIDDDVLKAERLFPQAVEFGVRRKFIIINSTITMYGGWNEACWWAMENGLVTTHPREVFAVSKDNPSLDQKIGIKTIYLHSTTEFQLNGIKKYCCSVKWGCHRRTCFAGPIHGSNYTEDFYLFHYAKEARRP